MGHRIQLGTLGVAAVVLGFWSGPLHGQASREPLERFDIHGDRGRLERELGARMESAPDAPGLCALARLAERRQAWADSAALWQRCGGLRGGPLGEIDGERAALMAGWPAGYAPTRPQQAALHRNRAEHLLAAGVPGEAVAVCREARRLQPQDWRNDALLATALMNTDRIDEALQSFSSALALAPPGAERDALSAAGRLARTRLETRRRLEAATAALAAEDLSTAEDQFYLAWSAQPGLTPAAWTVARLAAGRGDYGRVCGVLTALAASSDGTTSANARRQLERLRAEKGKDCSR